MKINSLLSIVFCSTFFTLFSCKEENQPPTCIITSPANAAEYFVGDTIIISAEAEDLDGTVVEVRFYVNGISIGSANSYPYSYIWETDDATIGLYKLKATAFDDENTSTSDEIEIAFVEIFCPNTITDIDGNTYTTVLIGDQCWMKENLRVSHYPNGNSIPYITDNNAWLDLMNDNTYDAHCYYNNISSEYGVLYSYAAAIADNWEHDNAEGQGICPDDWHLPTDAEWGILEGTVDTQYPVGDSEWNEAGYRGYDAGTHLKSTIGWISNGDNSSSYTALPGGYRSYFYGGFFNAGYGGYWWSVTESGSEHAWYRYLYYNIAHVGRSYGGKSNGLSVRCVWDN